MRACVYVCVYVCVHVCVCACMHVCVCVITCDGNQPPNRIEADRRMFPAGMFLMNGWLSHSRM